MIEIGENGKNAKLYKVEAKNANGVYERIQVYSPNLKSISSIIKEHGYTQVSEVWPMTKPKVKAEYRK